MASGPPGFKVNKSELELMNAGKGLLVLPSSTVELLDDLEKMEKRLERVLQMPSESMKYALQPVIRALIAKQLLRHPDLEVNISVACCICEVYEGKKTSDELSINFSNSPDVVIKMKNIMTMIIEKSETLNRELVDLLVTSVRKENKIASPVCWQLGGEVLKNCAAHLKPHLDEKVVKEVYSSLTETITSTTDTSKLRKDATTHKTKRECLDGSRKMVDAKERGKKSPLFDNPSMPTKSVTEERAESLVGRRIKVWWSEDKSYYRGVVKSFDSSTKRHKVLYDDGVEELIDLNQERWELVEITSSLSNFETKLMNAGRRLLPLPSSTAELLRVLRQIENFLHRVQEKPSASTKYAMYPIIEALVAKELPRHSDMNVNISVACCICDVLRIMDYNASYNEEQMKLESSDVIIIKMKKILTIIIEESEPLNLELVDLLVTSVRKENQIASPVCWELGDKVIKTCAAKLKPFLPDKVCDIGIALYDYCIKKCHFDVCQYLSNFMIIEGYPKIIVQRAIMTFVLQLAKEVYESLGETIPSTTNTSKVMKNTTHKRKHKCLDGIRNRIATPKRRLEYPDGNKSRVNVLHIHSEDDKKPEEKTLSSDDPLMPSTSVTEVLYDNAHEEHINLKNEQGKSVEHLLQREEIAPILESIFEKHGDIAAGCFFKTSSVRTSFLELICEVFKRIESSDVSTVISDMEDIQRQVSDADSQH
ncbi:phospholipase-like protein [Tanacetum coccineum]|uniref:Phospholipase-like protein n=1 Tax=Tanacetum coccineum TaxID=301880 RepID=A0ABQ5JEX4_9ASTR